VSVYPEKAVAMLRGMSELLERREHFQVKWIRFTVENAAQ